MAPISLHLGDREGVQTYWAQRFGHNQTVLGGQTAQRFGQHDSMVNLRIFGCVQ